MALQQNITIDSIESLENGILQIRQRTDVFDDITPKNIIGFSYHRWTLSPGDDLTDQDPKVAAIANATWTPDVITTYKANQKATSLLTGATE